jgi:glycerophosphoryl diester phosphodiesterase
MLASRSRARGPLPRVIAAGVIGALLAAGYAIALFRAAPVAPHPFFADLPHRPIVIAHRGSAVLWPENTLLAFRQALDLGADILELDLRTTSDGEIVVLHDETVDRTTDGSGRVREMTYEELRRLDAGHRFFPIAPVVAPEGGHGVTVPTIDEVLSTFSTARLNLEIKEPGNALAASLCERILHYGAGDRVLVASFHVSAVHAFRAECPSVATTATVSEAKRFLVASRFPGMPYVPAAQALQLPERFRGIRVVDRRTTEAARQANLPLYVFTINDVQAVRRLLAAGVDGFVTDRPDVVLAEVQVTGR